MMFMVYKINPLHRNGSTNKSQWTISENSEIQCFELARVSEWLLPRKGWGLYIVESKPEWLGVAQDHVTQVFIAKFVHDENSSEWHGYPADYRNNQQDIPEEKILKKWLLEERLLPAKIRKIAKGQPCNL